MLPPVPSPKRDVNVSIRFSASDYERFKQIADYRHISITALMHYVLTNTVLPKLEREVQHEQRQEPTPAPAASDTTELSSWFNISSTEPVEEPKIEARRF